MGCDAIEFRLGIARRLDCTPWRAGLAGSEGLSVIQGEDATLSEFLKLGKLDAVLVGPEALATAPAGSRILSGGCVACPTESLTDRVLSRVAAADIHRLSACGEQAATPSLVTRCLWADVYGQVPEVVVGGEMDPMNEDVDGVLWTGTCGPTPAGFRYSMDLGRMWFEATGLPLVWRVWVARPGAAIDAIDEHLRQARRQFSRLVAAVADEVAADFGWEPRVVRRVLAELRSYALGEDELDAVDELLFRAEQAGFIASAHRGPVAGC